jgi:ubiquitin carboxyl-terminal hydrolase 36/42
VSKKKANSIASAFQEFTRKETLDANNQWRCSGCKKDVCPTKQLTVFRPPLALCIQLKRFTYGGTFGFGSFAGFSNGMNFVSGIGGGNKITKAIEFPACLRLPLSDGRRCEYKLTGIVVHLGNNATSGHYTSFVRKPGLNGSWYHMDDSFVEPVSEKTVLRQKDAYVLFYCRTEVKLELPSPPLKVSMTTEQAKLVSMTRSQAASRAVATKDSYGLSQIPNESDPKEQGINIFGQEGEATKFATESQTAIESYSAPVTGSTDRQESIKNDVSKSEPENKHQQHVHLSSESIEDDSDKATGRHDVESEPKEEVTEKELAGCGNDTKRSNIPNEASSSSRNREPSNSGGRAESEVDGQKQNTSNLLDSSSLNEINVEGKQPDVSQDKKNTRVMIDRGTAQGKLEVMIGPRYKVKKKWQPKYTYARSSEENLALLGTRMIPKWDDPDNKEEHYAANKILARTTVVESLQKAENERKRSMHLDRWDAALDQGRTKKVKIKQHDQPDVLFAAENNPFYRIQSGIQKMNRQRAKGFHHPQNATSRHSSKKKDRRRFSKHKF